VTRDIEFPWRPWSSLALFAVAMACAWRAATTSRQRWPFAAACAALVAAVVEFFF
jgi:hypothetical protein